MRIVSDLTQDRQSRIDGSATARGQWKVIRVSNETRAQVENTLKDRSDEHSNRFGVPVRSDDYERLDRAFDTVRQAERAAERDALTRRVY